jgi:hypothetical protein
MIIDETRNVQSLLLWILDEMIDDKITFISGGHSLNNKTLSLSISDSAVLGLYTEFSQKLFKRYGLEYIQYLFKIANNDQITSFKIFKTSTNRTTRTGYYTTKILTFPYTGEIDECRRFDTA